MPRDLGMGRSRRGTRRPPKQDLKVLGRGRSAQRAQSRLLVETAIESGLRWGELTELRVCDIEFATRMLTVSRAVVSLVSRFHPNGGWFLVKEYPKDGEYRRFKLSVQITGKLRAHVTERGLGRDDLIFQAPPWTSRGSASCGW
jgi:integrase